MDAEKADNSGPPRGNTMIFTTCEGSNAGELSNQAAVGTNGEEVGRMFCLAGHGGQLRSLAVMEAQELKEVLKEAPTKG